MLKGEIVNLPNLISLIRILMAPVLLWLAITQQPVVYLVVLLFTVFTDVLDGFLARQLNQITEMGSHLDSWGDFIVYTVMAISAWLLWPEIVVKESISFLLILFSLIMPVLIGFLKFGVFTSYHTWSVKLAVAVTIVSYVLLFSGWLDWPFRVAVVVCLYAAIEETGITFILKHERADVRTIFHAIKLSRVNNKK